MNYTPYRNLWLSVIKQMLEDFAIGKLKKSYFKSKDFEMVCTLAKVKPAQVFKANPSLF